MGHLFLVVGNSGSGKDTLIREVQKRFPKNLIIKFFKMQKPTIDYLLRKIPLSLHSGMQKYCDRVNNGQLSIDLKLPKFKMRHFILNAIKEKLIREGILTE